MALPQTADRPMKVSPAAHLAGLSPGDHACLLYEDRTAQLLLAAEYVSVGLGRHERCLYIFDDHDVSELRGALLEAGVDVERCERTGQLALLTKHATYFSGGRFEPQEMLGYLRTAIEQARRDGWGALRVAGETTWAFSHEPGVDRFFEYEARLGSLSTEWDATILCMYNARKLPAAATRAILATHPIVSLHNRLLSNTVFFDPGAVLGTTSDAERNRWAFVQLLYVQQVEEALLRYERDLNLILDAIPVAVVIVGSAGRVVRANKKACEVLRYRRGDLLSLPWSFIADRGWPTLALPRGSDGSTPEHLRRGDGSTLPVRVSATSLPGGLLEFVIGESEDSGEP